MTRCYEYYCMFRKLPEKCELSESGEYRVKQCMKLLEEKGVKFDGKPSDKQKFKSLVEQVSELLPGQAGERGLTLIGH